MKILILIQYLAQNNLPMLVLGEAVNEPLPLSLDTLKIKINA